MSFRFRHCDFSYSSNKNYIRVYFINFISQYCLQQWIYQQWIYQHFHQWIYQHIHHHFHHIHHLQFLDYRQELSRKSGTFEEF